MFREIDMFFIWCVQEHHTLPKTIDSPTSCHTMPVLKTLNYWCLSGSVWISGRGMASDVEQRGRVHLSPKVGGWVRVILCHCVCLRTRTNHPPILRMSCGNGLRSDVQYCKPESKLCVPRIVLRFEWCLVSNWLVAYPHPILSFCVLWNAGRTPQVLYHMSTFFAQGISGQIPHSPIRDLKYLGHWIARSYVWQMAAQTGPNPRY